MKTNEIITESGAAPIYVFSYGMLTDSRRMTEAIARVGMAELKNFKFELLSHANVYPEAGSSVFGGLWEIDREFLSILDMIEGFPVYYDRKTVPVYVDGQKYVAELYTMTPQAREWRIDDCPSATYVRDVAKGYRSFGVPLTQLAEALMKFKRPDQQRTPDNPIRGYRHPHRRQQQKGDFDRPPYPQATSGTYQDENPILYKYNNDENNG